VSWWDRWVWRRVEQREQLTLEQLLADQGTPTAAGEAVTTDSAMRLSAVWACIRLLSDAVSTLPVHAYRRGERDPLPDLPPLLRSPAAGMSLPDWLYGAMVSLLVAGNCYGRVVARSGAGLLPAQVELLHPDRVGVSVNGDGMVTYRLNGTELDPADVWHVRAYVFPGSVVGLSPIQPARQAVGLGLAAERFGGRWFGDGATPQGVLTSDQRINTEQAEALRDRWDARHKGRRRIAVLGDGAKFQPITVPPEESQFLETTKANVATIARFYGVPPEMVAGETAGHMAYTSPELRSLDLLTYAVRPWLVRLENAISALLPRRLTVKFNADAIVRVDLKTRYEAHEIGLRAGFLTLAEVRELVSDLPERGGPFRGENRAGRPLTSSLYGPCEAVD
jgi:HK97 family phage portal protein